MKAEDVLEMTDEEIRVFEFDFTEDLDPGESIQSSPTPTITVTPAGGPTVSNILTSATAVQAKFTGGAVGTYHASCLATTTTQVRELCGDLKIGVC